MEVIGLTRAAPTSYPPSQTFSAIRWTQKSAGGPTLNQRQTWRKPIRNAHNQTASLWPNIFFLKKKNRASYRSVYKHHTLCRLISIFEFFSSSSLHSAADTTMGRSMRQKLLSQIFLIRFHFLSISRFLASTWSSRASFRIPVSEKHIFIFPQRNFSVSAFLHLIIRVCYVHLFSSISY